MPTTSPCLVRQSPAATVEVFDGATQIGTATANASGAWTFATGTLADGNHAFTGKAMDAAGNVSAASAALNVTVDTVAPATPTVASFSPDSGKAGDGITNANHISLAGTAAAGSTVEVFDGATQIGTATANASGAWTFATGTLADGSHAFTTKAMDTAGNLSAASAALNVTVDTVAPGAPVLVSDNSAANNSVNVTGTAEAGSKVSLYEGTTLLGTGVANSSGNWTINTGSLSAGAHDFTATATDAAGNVSAISADLDPVVGAIEMAGSTAPIQIGNNYYLDTVSGGAGPELKLNGAAFTAGMWGGWTLIGAEATATGYEVAFKFGTNTYTVWNTDANGNITDQCDRNGVGQQHLAGGAGDELPSGSQWRRHDWRSGRVRFHDDHRVAGRDRAGADRKQLFLQSGCRRHRVRS